MEVKICPLLKMAQIIHTVGSASAECLKEKCEWWDEDLKICAIVSISQEIGYANKLTRNS